MKKTIGIAVILILFISCTKDPDTFVDERWGTYSCLEITSGVTADSAGNFINYTDTSATSVSINVQSWLNHNYLVSGPYFSFHTSSFFNGEYNSQCPSGPCPTIKFYAIDSIRVYMKTSNPVRVVYIGKKQEVN